MVSLLDANVIIRLLIETEGELFQKSQTIFALIEAGELQVIIPAAVVAECLYIMTGFYKRDCDISANLLRKVFLMPGVINDDTTDITEALRIFANTKLDFVDAYLLALHESSGYEIISFDRDIGKYLKKHG